LTFQTATGLWKSSRESAFYLSNHPILAGQAAEAIRKHWGIENKLHHTSDVTPAPRCIAHCGIRTIADSESERSRTAVR
jgi:predicted transposase YbfD/YdcC